tara:strand:- start:2376 stop:3050 length:675 start_codon:yes stop_codon:yes gene_type:complete
MINKIIKAFKIIFYRFIDSSKGIVYVKEYIPSKILKSLNPNDRNKIKTLKSVINTLEKLKINYSISKGTLLGLSRDNKLIKNDIDIDIDIFSEPDIYKLIQYNKFSLFRTIIYKGRYSNIVFYDKENQMLIDIAVFYRKENFFINHSPYGEFVLSENLIKSISSTQFRKDRILSYNRDEYLTFWYGKDWITPQPYTHDWIYHYKKSCRALNFYNHLSVTIDLTK